MEDKEKEVIVDEENKEEVETPIVETEPDAFMKVLEAIADLKGDIANLIQKSEAIESPLEETVEETTEETSEEKPEEDTTEVSEEEQEDISDMFKD